MTMRSIHARLAQGFSVVLLTSALAGVAASAAETAAAPAVSSASAAAPAAAAATPAAAPAIAEAPKLSGLVLINDPKKVAKGSLKAKGVQVNGLPLLDQSDDFKERLRSYLGQPFSEDVRAKIVNDVVLFYRSQGRAVVDVSTPPQELTGGVLQVLVLEGKVGKVHVDGARWFDSKYVAKQIRAQAGQDLKSDDLAKDLDWINRNPFRQVDLVYAKGSELGQTDLVLRETDAFPLRAYTGFEDSGTDLTGNDRLLAGVNWGNVLGVDGQLNYQFMTDPAFLYFKAHSVTYVQPLPWRHTLTLLGSYATTHGKVPAPFDLGGYNWQTSARYEVPLPDGGSNYRQTLTGGFDYKRANNSLAFGGVTAYGTTADTAQFSLAYGSTLKDIWGGTTFRATLFYSPGELTPQDTNEVYNQSRAGSSANYTYGKVEINRTTGLPYDFMLMTMLTGQLTDANLLASEQLGFGGYDTIRGYDTRVVNADEGFIFSNELRTPPFSLLSLLRLKNAPPDKLQFLGFVDYGGATNMHLLPGEEKTHYLLGVGPGLRYTVSTHLSVRADYGWQLLKSSAYGPNSMRWNVGVVLSY